MTDYKYDKNDSRELKTLYMYSEYGGKVFLKSYFAARRLLLESLASSIKALDDNSEHPTSSDNALNKPDLPAPRTQAIDSRSVIQSCIVSLKNRLSLEQVFEWVEDLCRKIEVAKRLYCQYDVELKPVGGKDDAREVSAGDYAQLACLFALALEYRSDLRWLNVLLKLNDLVGFQLGKITDKLALQAASDAIGGELVQIRKLAKRNGLDLVNVS
jgi:hypothetical protein